MRIQSTITIAVCLVASASCSPISSGLKKYRQPFKVGFDNAFKIDPSSSLSVKKDFSDLRGGGKAVAPKSLPAFLKWAYSAVGLATTAVSSSNIPLILYPTGSYFYERYFTLIDSHFVC
jgi:hypothetical protein